MSQNDIFSYLGKLEYLAKQLGDPNTLPATMTAKMTAEMSPEDKAKVNDVISRIDFDSIKDKNMSKEDMEELIKGKM